jgi:mRNA interferase MazF
MSTPSTTGFSRGDVALVRFVFADEQGAKRRPALIVSTDRYHAGRQEVIVVALTSNIGRLLPGDYLMVDWAEAGLPLPSVITGIVRTIKAPMIEGVLGHVSDRDIKAVEGELRSTLGLLAQGEGPSTSLP